MWENKEVQIDKKSRKSNHGFSLIELLIYVGLTAVLLGLFSGVLVTILRLQNHQSASNQVLSELNFVMSRIKQEIRDSDSMTINSQRIIVHDASGNTKIELTSGAIIIDPPDAGATPLTSQRVNVDDFTYTEKTGSNGVKTVELSLTFSYISDNPQQQATHSLTSTALPINQ